MNNSILSLALALSLTAGASLPTESAQTTQSAQATWKINSANSQFKFHLKNMGLPVDGKFTKLAGDIIYDGKDLANATVSATVDTSSIETGIGMRDNHLKGKDFFNIAKFPAATFTSSKIDVKPNGEFQITGKLSLHGIPQEVILDATPLKEQVDSSGITHLQTTASASLKRKSFGIGGLAAATIGNDVNLDLKIDLIK